MHSVPFYSQFADISAAKWKKVGCGITDLAMVINYYKPGAVTVDTLLAQGLAAGAYRSNAGWTYQGLIDVSKSYGLDGSYFDLAGLPDDIALARLKAEVSNGPIIASVHYKFDPKNPIPHMVVVNDIIGDTVYYNDPAQKRGEKQIALSTFLSAWKKRALIFQLSSVAAAVAAEG